jgi:hypothetical protein
MSECLHQWKMADVQFGFIAFERCSHCNQVRAFFSKELHPDLGDEYREGKCFWERVENAQSFVFNLRCTKCGYVESYGNLMGLLHCTGCMTDCAVDTIRRECAAERTWIAVAFSFQPNITAETLPAQKLDTLTDYFNQHRDTRRSRIRILSSSLIPDISRCRGDFIHDVGMLSREPTTSRKPLL